MSETPRLKFTDLADLLKKDFDPEVMRQRERKYRQGYADGWVVCVEAFAAAMGQHAYIAGMDFWEQLLLWVREGTSRRRQPPEMPYTGKMRRLKPLSAGQRMAILKRDGYRCRLCGAMPADGPHIRLHVDHIIPRARGGTNAKQNLQTLCSSCNIGKGTNDL